MAEIILISHVNRSWPGTWDLRTAADGWLLAVTKTPMRCAARRLREEGHPPSTIVTIRHCCDAEPEQRSTIKEALKNV